MSCEDFRESLNALLDGELPPRETGVLSAHLATCPACTRMLAELAALRAGLAEALPPQDAPAALHARIEALLIADEPKIISATRKPRRWPGWATATATALAAALLLSFMPHHDVTKDLMSVHDAALRGTPAISATGIQISPLAGFQPAGARMDEVAGHLAQVSVYTKNGENFTLCRWAANGEPAHGVNHAQFRGMTIIYWNDGRNEYWAAGTASDADMRSFVAMARAAS